MLSDVLNLPLRTVGPSEGAPLGAAILAAVGAGTFAHAADAGNAWLINELSVEPNQDVQKTYAEGYERYRDLYPALKNTFSSGNSS